MAALTVRNLHPDVKARLRLRAAQQGIAMEEAIRRILTRAATEPDTPSSTGNDLGTRIQARFSGLGELKLPARHPTRVPPFAAETKD